MLPNTTKISMYSKYNLSYEPKFYIFHDLMTKKIQEILLVSTLYDNFILEEDTRLSEKLFELYNKFNLSAPPRMTRVSSPKEALELIDSGEKKFDLIITMRRLADMNPFEFGYNVKKRQKNVPVVLLINNPIDLKYIPKFQKNIGIDRIFLWTGDSELLLAIIKYFEDLLNVDQDIEIGQIQIILLVENSVKWYSIYLPMLFSEVMKQTQILIEESLNDYHRLLRMRARPKILLAENYEEAMEIFNKYKNYILGVFSDIVFERNGKLDQESGTEFIKEVKKFNELLPTLLLSSNETNWKKAKELKSAFIYKYSPNAKISILNFLLKNLGFGDFVFRLKDGTEVGRAKNISELIDFIQTVPDDSLIFHASNNHFSAFLMARGEITLAYKLRPIKITEFKDMPTFRLWMCDILHETLQSEQHGVIVDFSEKTNSSKDVIFQRIGSGSLGGKGRGLAFLNTLITLGEFAKAFPDIKVAIPSTLVLCTDEFDKFIQNNNLYSILSEKYTDDEIITKFLAGNFASSVVNNLILFLDYHKFPIAVRSSSLLEDTQYLPFAGIYKTYMLPNNNSNIYMRLEQLLTAIKLVYASVYLDLPRKYMEIIGSKIEEEKMAVIIQELIGNQHEERFYPDISGVVQSYNFYPVSYLKPEDGVAHAAIGLGKIVVEGEKVLRFSPKYPHILPQFSSPKDYLTNSQNEFYALDLQFQDMNALRDGETSSLKKWDLKIAETDGLLSYVGSTFDPNDNIIRDGVDTAGIRIINFAGILKYDIFPLAKVLEKINNDGTSAMGCPIEIEFAIRLNANTPKRPEFYLLQIRPLVTEYEIKDINIDKEDTKNIIYSDIALGNGVIHTIEDIILVRPEHFDSMKTYLIANEIALFNKKLYLQKKTYILIGPGRWGSSDQMLGIPVKWNDISAVKVMVEIGLPDYNIDPSYGTHFFQNLVSLQIIYFTIPYKGTNSLSANYISWEWINNQKVVDESYYIRHIRVNKPLLVKVNGKTREGVIADTSKEDFVYNRLAQDN